MSQVQVLAVSWWCQSSTLPWTWTPKVYLGVWAMISLLVVPYAIVMRRRARTHGLDGRDKRAILWFALGTMFLWSASDWPLGTLGAGYLLSMHTVLYLIYTMAAAPLLLLGIPSWMARGMLDRLRAWGVYRTAVPPVGGRAGVERDPGVHPHPADRRPVPGVAGGLVRPRLPLARLGGGRVAADHHAVPR